MTKGNTKGIVFRETDTTKGRKMILLFTREYGKIGAGAYRSAGKKTKSGLSTKPFTLGEYRLNIDRDRYYIESGEPIKSYYDIGEDVDRYFAASFVLELTDKVTPEELPQPKIFDLLKSFMDELEKRKKKHETLVIAYEVKLLDILGVYPVTDRCAVCGKEVSEGAFSVRDGGLVCSEHSSEASVGVLTGERPQRLIYNDGFDIVKVVDYFDKTPLSGFSGIALSDDKALGMQKIVKEYMEYHLDLGKLKSEGLFSVVE